MFIGDSYITPYLSVGMTQTQVTIHHYMLFIRAIAISGDSNSYSQ